MLGHLNTVECPIRMLHRNFNPMSLIKTNNSLYKKGLGLIINLLFNLIIKKANVFED